MRALLYRKYKIRFRSIIIKDISNDFDGFSVLRPFVYLALINFEFFYMTLI